MSISYYWSYEFFYVSTTNLFNLIALFSAILFILDPIVFLGHTGYNVYHKYKHEKDPAPEKRSTAKDLSESAHWWKWHAVSAGVHLLDAWFFRSIIPFLERARANRSNPPSPDDFQDLADICRLLWGIVRTLSLFVIALEIWEQRLLLKTVLGTDKKNPKWAFAVSYFITPAIIAVAAIPVVVYFLLLALRNSTGFLWSVIKEAFTPDWRHGQDVFVKTAIQVKTVIATVTATPSGVSAWKFWAKS